jgi:hypothetical protein
MAMLEVNWNPSRKELKQFAGIWFPLACAVLCGVLYRWNVRVGVISAFASIAAVVAVVGYFIPAVSRAVYVGWMVAAFPLGWTISHLVMGLVYYVLITPMGLIMRWCGRDSMGRTFDPGRDSYWVPRTPPKDKQQYFRQY